MTDSAAQADRQWWSEQWLDLINAYRFKKRLERGWKYAREGNVISIRFEGQKVNAKVQGTEPKPYRVSLWLDPLTDEDWAYVIATLSQRSVFSAKLLAGEMPHNIEEVFAANGLRLFPFQLSDVRSRCSCLDKANPCKHVSAVYYLMGDRFSEDPFMLFQLRGRTREQILQALRDKRANSIAPADDSSPLEEAKPIPTSLSLENFWTYDAQLDPSLVVITPPTTDETLLDVLGPIPLNTIVADPELAKSQQAALMDYLKQVYQKVGYQAMVQALGQGNR